MKSLQFLKIDTGRIINPAHVVCMSFYPAGGGEPIEGDEGGGDTFPAQLNITMSSIRMVSEGETAIAAASESEKIILRGPGAVAVWEMFESYAMYPVYDPAEERHLA